MYFQLDNTPENVKKLRKAAEVSGVRELPCLELAPFTPHPLVIFENVPVGSVACRKLQIYNPASFDRQIAVIKPPPADLCLELSWTETVVLADDIVIMELRWSPKSSSSQRFTMQMTDQKKGRFNVVVVCKSAVNKKPGKVTKKKLTVVSKPTGLMRTPKAKTRRSPKTKFYIPCGDQYKNVLEMGRNVVTEEYQTVIKQSEFINICPQLQNPGPTANSADFRRETYLVNDPECDKENDISFQMKMASNNFNNDYKTYSPNNILSAVDNLEFTPLKVTEKYYETNKMTMEQKYENFQYVLTENSPRLNRHKHINEKNIKLTKPYFDYLIDNLENSPLSQILRKLQISEDIIVQDSIIFENVNQNCGSAFEDKTEYKLMQNVVPHQANLTHSIIDLCDVTMPSKSEEVVHSTKNNKPDIVVVAPDNPIIYEEVISGVEVSTFTPSAKYNISELSLSLDGFNPNRCSTERKDSDKAIKSLSINEKITRDLMMSYSPAEGLNSTYGKLSSGTYTKGESPIIPMRPSNQSSPYSVCGSPAEPVYKPPPPSSNTTTLPRMLQFTENTRGFMERNNLKNSFKEKNTSNSVKDIIEANLWQKTSPRPVSPSSLAVIPEEPTLFEMSSIEANKKCETFIINETFEISKPVSTRSGINNEFEVPKAVLQTSHVDHTKWSKTGLHTENKKTSILHRSFQRGERNAQSDIQRDSEHHYKSVKSISTTIDPFLASTCLYDERAYDELQLEFKKWLNYLLTPPADLETNLDDSKVDVGKAWIESRNKAVPAAPTKEQVSANYHTSHRLASLRKSARAFSEKQHIKDVFIKVTTQVEKKLLSMREDRNIHVNIGLQKVILNLLLCYNPLWLRIGLESLYGRNIPLSSNNDIMGLSSFIIEYMFKDPYSSTKHSTNMCSLSYVETIKKFALKKFLCLVYFLDQAKLNKIIPHDPCLFCRNGLFKASREILFQFTKEVISGVGDITKHLKPTGYVVSHKQTFLHEFKYAVHNLGVDLKDGVRLTRLMEIILMRDDLTSGLRTPAISRLQKIYNVKIAFTALESAGFTIVGDITPKDIADGHREKTLSLLWQLINKFRAPLFCQSALVIQKWWRKKYFKISIEKRIEYKKKYKYHVAASKIQSCWKAYLLKKTREKQTERETYACIVIQKNWKMCKCRQQFITHIKAILTIQRWFRTIGLIKNAKTLLKNMRLNTAATKIQRWYRLKQFKQVLATQNTEREQFLRMKESANTIQRAVRAYLAMKKDRKVYVTLRVSTVKIQQYYRAVVIKRYVRKQYLQLKSTTVYVQRKFRANLLRNHCQKEYNNVRCGVIKIQFFFRSWLFSRQVRNDFIKLRSAAITIQLRYRALCTMRKERELYLYKRRCAIYIQKYLRGYIQMKIDRKNYLDRLAASRNATREAAAIVIQHKYRGYMHMETERGKYLILRSSTIKIQKMFRYYLITKSTRHEFLILKTTAIFIQRKYRAKLAMLKCLKQYEERKSCAVVIQRFYKSYRLMKMEREQYKSVRQAVVTIQSKYRGLVARREYVKKRKAVISLQSYCRMFILRKRYQELKESVIVVQRHYRSSILTRQAMREYEARRVNAIKERQAARKIQSVWKMYCARKEYVQLKMSIVKCQIRWRAILEMRKCIQDFHKTKQSIVRIQALARSYLVRKSIAQKTLAATRIQTMWRRYTACKKYANLKKSTIVLQREWRSIFWFRKYQALKKSCIVIQSAFRSYHERKKTYAAIKIQSLWRKYSCYRKYQNLKKYVLFCQRKRIALLAMRQQRSDYNKTINGIVLLQSRIRGYLARKAYSQMCEQHNELKNNAMENKAATVIQAHKSAIDLVEKFTQRTPTIPNQKHWRGYEVRKKQAEHCRVAALRKRWQEGALKSDQLTLAERNQDAMDVLCHFKDVASVIRAFKTLDYVTKVYPMMYGTRDTALPIITRLVTYMGATNRSVSILETLQLGAAILLNLTKYVPTAHYVYEEEHIDTIVTLMLHWCDKDGLLSRQLCTLLWMFGKYEDLCNKLTEVLKTPKLNKILCKVRSGLVRRKKMEGRKRNSIHVALPSTPYHFKPSFNDSLKLNMSLVKQGKGFTSHLPSTEPDFGIERTDQPRIFMDEIQAIDAVFLKYRLTIPIGFHWDVSN